MDDVENLIENLRDHYMRQQLSHSKTRHEFAMIAAQIAGDRYNAGSTAALVTIYLLSKHGIQVAKDFVADLEHHED